MKPGDIDAKGRRFLGWRVKCTEGHNSVVLPSRKMAEDQSHTSRCKSIVRVFRKQSATKLALFGLVRAFDAPEQAINPVSDEVWAAITFAWAVLK